MNIQGFQKTTLLDYPKHVASTVFLGGCNFRCPFCHNKDLVLPPLPRAAFSEQEVLDYLEKRREVLDGVCISGGEPTLQGGLADFLRKIKDLGLLIKLDTNGYEPSVLKDLCRQGLIDYVAMDIKGPLASYPKCCGLDALDLEKIKESVDFLLKGTVEYEFRSTVAKGLHARKDIEAIGKWISGARAYYLQSYQDSPQVISPGFFAYSEEEMKEFQELLLKDIPFVALRG